MQSEERPAAPPDRDGAPGSASEAGSIEAMIDELVAHSTELARALHDNAVMLAALRSERPPTHDSASSDGASGDHVALAPDVATIAMLAATAAGVSVEEYVREAVLEYSARDAAEMDSALQARLREARREAKRARADHRAVRAQSEQAAAKRADVQARADATAASGWHRPGTGAPTSDDDGR